VEKSKGGKPGKSAAASSAKEKIVKKVLLTKPGDGAYKLHKSEDVALKQMECIASRQTEYVQPLVEHQQPSSRPNVEGRSGMEVRKLMDIPAVQQQKKVVALMDLEVAPRNLQPVGDTFQTRKVMTESQVLQKHLASNFRETSHSKVETDSTVSADRKSSETTLPVEHVKVKETTPPVEHVQEQVDVPEAADVPQDVLITAPVTEAVVEEPTTEAEPETNGEPEVLPPVSDEVDKTDPGPESIPPDQTAPQPIAIEKTTEVATKNIAEVKPLLVASVPEKSRWEREAADISVDIPLYRSISRERDRRIAATKTTLPRSVCTRAALLLFELSDIH